jgi:hypothetical protein
MSCQHESNEIDRLGLPENEKYVDKTDTRDEPLRGQDSKPAHIGTRSTNHLHEVPDPEAENAHSWHLHLDDRTAQRSAADAENIAPSRGLRREDQTAQRLAEAMKKSNQQPPSSPAPPIACCVTRIQCNASAEASMASIDDPFTYAEAMESPQRDHWKIAMEEESTSIVLNNTCSSLNYREARQLQV